MGLRISTSSSVQILITHEFDCNGRIHVGFDNKTDPPIAIMQTGVGNKYPQIKLTLKEARELNFALTEIIEQAQSSTLEPISGRTIFPS